MEIWQMDQKKKIATKMKRTEVEKRMKDKSESKDQMQDRRSGKKKRKMAVRKTEQWSLNKYMQVKQKEEVCQRHLELLPLGFKHSAHESPRFSLNASTKTRNDTFKGDVPV